jgi:hypothetical protein
MIIRDFTFQVPSSKISMIKYAIYLEFETWNLELYSTECAEATVNRDDGAGNKTGCIGAKKLNQSV